MGRLSNGRGGFSLMALKSVKSVPVLVLVAGIVFLLARESNPSGVYVRTAHSDSDTGAVWDWGVNASGDLSDTGVCSNCHLEHAHLNDADTPNLGAGYPIMLLNQSTASPWFNSTCFMCHQDTMANHDGWPGQTVFEAAAHWTTAGVVYPASGNNTGECLNCHNPHGLKISETDNVTGGPYGAVGTDPVNNLCIQQEEKLCLTCHDISGPATTDISSCLTGSPNNVIGTTFYSHPIDEGLADATLSYHVSSETATPQTTTDRHAECVDCHNPHYAQNLGAAGTSSHRPPTNLLPPALLGTWGVRIINTAAFTAPTFYQEQLTSLTTNFEYQLCFRCHSSFSGLPAWTTDVSIQFDTMNLSFHAVEDSGPMGGTGGYAPASFIKPWDRSSKLTCSDCHSPDPALAGFDTGPHGSNIIHILNGNWSDTTGGAGKENGHLCFDCHDSSVYSNYSTVVATGRDGDSTSYNQGTAGTDNLHYLHYGFNANIRCQWCHAALPHGQNARRHLIALQADAAPYETGQSRLTAYTARNGAYVKGDCTPAGECLGH